MLCSNRLFSVIPEQNSKTVKIFQLFYKVDYIAIFDDGNGFEVFDKKTDKRAHSEVAAVIKENLQYDPRFYDHNKEFF